MTPHRRGQFYMVLTTCWRRSKSLDCLPRGTRETSLSEQREGPFVTQKAVDERAGSTEARQAPNRDIATSGRPHSRGRERSQLRPACYIQPTSAFARECRHDFTSPSFVYEPPPHYAYTYNHRSTTYPPGTNWSDTRSLTSRSAGVSSQTRPSS